jgi:vacuolar protein sorting-associated protein 33A
LIVLTTRLDQIKRLQKEGSTEHEITIIWVPRRTLVSNKILEDEGVLGDVNIAELPLFFLPLENDLLSLESDEAFNDLYLVSVLDASPSSH